MGGKDELSVSSSRSFSSGETEVEIGKYTEMCVFYRSALHKLQNLLTRPVRSHDQIIENVKLGSLY